MEEKLTIENIKQKIGEIDLTDNGEFDVYNFFKQHPGLLITFLSAVVAVIGFINRTIQYSNLSDYLAYWGWENIKVEGAPGSISYTLAFSILNLTIIFIAGVIFFKYIDPHLKLSFMINEIGKINKKLDDDAKHFISNETRTIVLRIILTLIIVWILYAIDFALFYHYSIQISTVLVALIFAVVVVANFTVFCALYSRVEVKKRAAAAMKGEDSRTEKVMAVLSDYISKSDDTSVIKLIGNFSLKTLLTKKSIICTLLAVCMILFVSVMASSMLVPDTVDKRDFAITSMTDGDYMVVYNNNRTYYLNKVDIQDGVLRVHTNEHRIVYNNNTEIHDMYFDRVEK